MALVFGERYRNGGRGYWHEMGTEAQDLNETAASMAERAGLNYTIAKRAVSTRINGKHHNIEGTYALVSDAMGDPDVIAVVGKEFEPIQNMHLAEMLDRAGLVGPEGIYAMDVAGKTLDGRTVFWALKAREPFVVNGDEYRDHWLIADGKDGNRALTMALTPVRHICSNALAMAVAGASIKVGIQHTKAAEAELKWWLSIAPQLDAASRKSRGLLERLGNIQVTADDVETILDGAYPKPKARGRAQLYQSLTTLALNEDDAATVERAAGKTTAEAMRVLAKRSFVTDLFESYADDPDERHIAGTALGVVNAVADFENHRVPTNVREASAVSNMYGPRYAAQAGSIRAAMALAS
jgi:hypothetical protein